MREVAPLFAAQRVGQRLERRNKQIGRQRKHVEQLAQLQNRSKRRQLFLRVGQRASSQSHFFVGFSFKNGQNGAARARTHRRAKPSAQPRTARREQTRTSNTTRSDVRQSSRARRRAPRRARASRARGAHRRRRTPPAAAARRQTVPRTLLSKRQTTAASQPRT